MPLRRQRRNRAIAAGLSDTVHHQFVTDSSSDHDLLANEVVTSPVGKRRWQGLHSAERLLQHCLCPSHRRREVLVRVDRTGFGQSPGSQATRTACQLRQSSQIRSQRDRPHRVFHCERYVEPLAAICERANHNIFRATANTQTGHSTSCATIALEPNATSAQPSTVLARP